MSSSDSAEDTNFALKDRSTIYKFFRRVLQIINQPKRVRFSTIREARRAVIDFIGYVCFLTLIMVVSKTNTHPLIYSFNYATKNQLIHKAVAQPGLIGTYQSVNSLPKYWDFIQLKLLPFLESGDFRPGDPASVYKYENETNVFDEIYGSVRNRTIMHGNILMGPPRFRQIRVKRVECEFLPEFGFKLKDCYPEYSVFNEDRGGYRGESFESTKLHGTLPMWAKVKFYWGAGYIKSLTYDSKRNEELIRYLNESLWINRGSRLIVIEFNMFHVNSRLFQTVKFVAEFVSSGVCIPSIDIRSFPLYNFFNNPYPSVNIVHILYYICIFFATIREGVLIHELGFCKYLGFLINFMDFIVCLFSYLMIVLNVFHYIILNRVMHSLKTQDVYINLDGMDHIYTTYNNIVGLILFIAWIRLLIFMTFNRTLVILSNVLSQSSNEILGYLLMCFCILMAYAQCAMILFGCNEPKYRNIESSILTMVRWIVSDFVYTEMIPRRNFITTVYYLSFVIVAYLYFLFSFLGVVNSIYDEIKMNLETRPSKLTEFFRYYIRQLYDLIYFIVLRKRKVRPYVNIDEMDEMESDKRIDPQHAAAMAAMRRQAKFNPITLEPFEYLPGRLERAEKRVQTLEEVADPVLNNLLNYYTEISESAGVNQ